MIFFELIYRMKLFFQTIISPILNLIKFCFQFLFKQRKADAIELLFHLLTNLLIVFLIGAFANQFPYHFDLRHFTAI
jgi:hypothetical protein